MADPSALVMGLLVGPVVVEDALPAGLLEGALEHVRLAAELLDDVAGRAPGADLDDDALDHLVAVAQLWHEQLQLLRAEPPDPHPRGVDARRGLDRAAIQQRQPR